MKLNLFFACIATIAGLLLAYLAFHIAEGEENDVLCGVGSAVCFIGTLIPMLSISHTSSRIQTNLRLLSTLFFFLFMVSHFCFAAFGVRLPYYIIELVKKTTSKQKPSKR